MKIVFLLFKILLLGVGIVLISGGGLLSACGLIVNQGELAALGLLPILVGLVIAVPVIRDFNQKARAARKPLTPPPPADEGEA